MNNSAKSKKTTKLFLLLITLAIIAFVVNLLISESDTIGKYKKEELPQEFEYKIITDDSNKNLDKNQLEVEISNKLTEGQIATLAEKLFDSKEKQRRFYIFYDLKEENNNRIDNWATSHFDPELEISINGSTSKQDSTMLIEAKKVNGNIIGIFEEPEATASFYTLYENGGKTFLKTSFKNGQLMIEELVKTTTNRGIRLNTKEEVNGEYFILSDGVLRFYNKENIVFASASKVN